MASWFFHSVSAQISAAGLAIAGCLVAAWYLPIFRNWLIGAAGLIFAAAGIYAKGANDEKRKWNEQIDADIKKGKQARADAERDVAAGRVRDEWDRDRRL